MGSSARLFGRDRRAVSPSVVALGLAETLFAKALPN